MSNIYAKDKDQAVHCRLSRQNLNAYNCKAKHKLYLPERILMCA